MAGKTSDKNLNNQSQKRLDRVKEAGLHTAREFGHDVNFVHDATDVRRVDVECGRCPMTGDVDITRQMGRELAGQVFNDPCPNAPTPAQEAHDLAHPDEAPAPAPEGETLPPTPNQVTLAAHLTPATNMTVGAPEGSPDPEDAPQAEVATPDVESAEPTPVAPHVTEDASAGDEQPASSTPEALKDFGATGAAALEAEKRGEPDPNAPGADAGAEEEGRRTRRNLKAEQAGTPEYEAKAAASRARAEKFHAQTHLYKEIVAHKSDLDTKDKVAALIGLTVKDMTKLDADVIKAHVEQKVGPIPSIPRRKRAVTTPTTDPETTPAPSELANAPASLVGPGQPDTNAEGRKDAAVDAAVESAQESTADGVTSAEVIPEPVIEEIADPADAAPPATDEELPPAA